MMLRNWANLLLVVIVVVAGLTLLGILPPLLSIGIGLVVLSFFGLKKLVADNRKCVTRAVPFFNPWSLMKIFFVCFLLTVMLVPGLVIAYFVNLLIGHAIDIVDGKIGPGVETVSVLSTRKSTIMDGPFDWWFEIPQPFYMEVDKSHPVRQTLHVSIAFIRGLLFATGMITIGLILIQSGRAYLTVICRIIAARSPDSFIHEVRVDGSR